MVGRLVCKRRSSTITIKHVNLHVSLPVNSRRPTLSRSKTNSKYPTSRRVGLCSLVTFNETPLLRWENSRAQRSGYTGIADHDTRISMDDDPEANGGGVVVWLLRKWRGNMRGLNLVRL